MATLVASPFTSPLASPTRFVPGFHVDFQEEHASTTLFDGLLSTWDAVSSMTPRPSASRIDQQCNSTEPSAFPFPLIGSNETSTQTACDQPSENHMPLDTQNNDFSTWNVHESTEFPPDNAHVDFSGFLMMKVPENEKTHAPYEPVKRMAANQPTNESNTFSDDCFSCIDSLSNLDSFLDFEADVNTSTWFTTYFDDIVPESSMHSDLGDKQVQIQETPSTENSTPMTMVVSPPRSSPTAIDPEDSHYTDASSSRKRPRLQELKHNNEQHYLDDTGAVIGTLMTLGNEKSLRKPYSVIDRAKTKKTRERGACPPCKAKKKRCNRSDSPYECCDNCKLRMSSMPCFLAKIVDAQLFRDKPSPKHPRSALRPIIFESLTSITQKQQRSTVVTLTQDVGLRMLVRLARYDPIPGEVTHRTWKKDGQTQRIDMPPYCIANMQEAQCHMLEYIANFRSAWLKHMLGRSNEITRSLFDQAQRFAAFNPDSTVSKALSLCAASRIIERDWRVCSGHDALGLSLISDDPTNPFYGVIPIPPMLDAQLDQIVIKEFLVPIRTALLTQLESKMTAGNPVFFFEILLTVSVLLSHAEWLLEHSRASAKRVGAKTRYNYIPRAEGYFHACNTILAYWHHMCKGTSAAEMVWGSARARSVAKLDAEQIGFLEDLKRRITIPETKSMMFGLRDNNKYESELYWCHQLFFPEWKPGAKCVEDVKMTDV